jgi:4-amino-4-deoxy-L-arabinose transferase-like glycosyltransferase
MISTPEPAASASRAADVSSRTERLLLIAFVALAIAVRLWGLKFGLPVVYARPDELLLIGVVVGFFRGDPNPHFFEYPTLYLYVLAGVYCLFYARWMLAGWIRDSAGFAASFKVSFVPFFLAARATAAVLGSATVALVHAIVRPLFGVTAGLLAALFMAVAFLHVRDSHYATADVPMVFFVAAALLAIVRVHCYRRAFDARLAGVLAGCAMGVKYNAVVLVLPMAIVEGLHAWTLRRDFRRMLRETHVFTMAACCVLMFLAGSPYLLLDSAKALQDLRSLQASTSAGMTPPELLGRGWTYHLPHSLWYGVGWPMLLSALAGMAWMAVRRPGAALVLGSFPVAYYIVAGAGYNVFVRYMLPVVPFVCIFAGYFVASAASGIASVLRLRPALVAAVLGLAVAVPPARDVVQFDRLLTREDSRITTGRWLMENVPAGASMFISGNRYGHPAMDFLRYRQFGYDYRGNTFTADRRPTTELPQWLVIQRSPLPYSHVPDGVEELIGKGYQLAHVIRAYSPEARNFYDVQDGFYLPFGSFEGVERPGPNVMIYRRE